MIKVEAVLVEPVLRGRVVPGGEQILQDEDFVGAALPLLHILPFIAAVPERSLRSLVHVGQHRSAAVAVTIAATSGLIRRVPDVSVSFRAVALA